MTTTLVDLVKIVSNSVGTGPFQLGLASIGFRGREALTDGATYGYTVQQGANFESGYGAYSATAQTLSRTNILYSSNDGDLVAFTAKAEIAFTLFAEDLGGGGGGGAVINDSIISQNFVWSSFKTDAAIDASAIALNASISQLALATADALATKEGAIAAGLVTQYWRGDKTWQLLNKAAVGLGNVDNTSDANKPVSTPQGVALALKADKAVTSTQIGGVNVTITAAHRNIVVETITAGQVSVSFDSTLPAGACGDVLQGSTGRLTYRMSAGGVLHAPLGQVRSEAQWARASWYCRANPDGNSADIVIGDGIAGYDIQTLYMIPDNPGLAISEGIGYDGTYIYVTPHNEYIVAKVDPRSLRIVATLDLSTVSASLTALLGCFVSGRYLYILPHQSGGVTFQTDVVRVDLDNFTAAGVSRLTVISSPSNSYTPRDGFTDGTNGYINIRWPLLGIALIRFGLGANFNTGSVSTLQLTSTSGADGTYPIVQGNFLCCDDTNIYAIALAATRPASDPAGRLTDLWLVSVPISNFTAGAAVFTRLTHMDFFKSSVPVAYQLIDAGTFLWTVPMIYVRTVGSEQWLPPLKIPKANPSATIVTTAPTGQKPGSDTSSSGAAIYDGTRYGYAASGTESLIVQVDTLNPGVVNYIDIGPYGHSDMWGLLKAGGQGYAVGFNNSTGILLRFSL